MARTMLYKPGNMITCGQFAVDYIIVDDEEVKSHLKKGWVKNSLRNRNDAKSG